MLRTFLLALFASSLVTAAPYPDDQPLFKDCQTYSVVEACRTLQIRGKIAIDVSYNAWRMAGVDPMKVWIRVQNRDHNRDQIYSMTRVKDEQKRIVRVTNGCLKGKAGGGCETQGTREMLQQLEWTNNGFRLNELKLEVAFQDSQGNWDSRGGRNFHFWFPERAGGE